MKVLTPATLVAAALVAILSGPPMPAAHTMDDGGREAAGLPAGAKSVDDLIAQLLQALREKDRGALRELRVTEKEYREVILPGSVKPGEARRQYAPDFTDFLWGSLNTRNYYSERDLVGGYGGKAFSLRGKSFTGGGREFDAYTSSGRLNITLTDDEGNEVLLEMGPVARLGDRYKFISFGRD